MKDKVARAAWQRNYNKIHSHRLSRMPSSRYGHWTGGARRRKIEVSISKKEWWQLVKGADCHYCGLKIVHGVGSNLDRKNIKIGYKKSNVVPCCKECNYIKGQWLTYKEAKYLLPLLRKFREHKRTQ